MTHGNSLKPERPKTGLRGVINRIPGAAKVGIVVSLILALVGLASGGFWTMIMTLAIVLLATAAFGLIFKRSTWLRLPRTRAASAITAGVAMAVLIGSTAAFGASHPTSAPAANSPAVAAVASASASPSPQPNPTTSSTSTPTPTPTHVVVTKTLSANSYVAFTSTMVSSSTLPKGTSRITTPGVRGVETKTYHITFTDGVESSRTLVSDKITTAPVTQVTTVGTYVAPAAPAAPTCTNGTYVNSAGNTVCRPEVSSSAPSGATAKCVDGTYSFSQSRRGTCSSHGGVAQWL